MQPIKIDIQMSDGNWQIIMTVPRWLQKEWERQQDGGAKWFTFNTWIESGNDGGAPAGYSFMLRMQTPMSPDLPTTVSSEYNEAFAAPDTCERNPLGLWQHSWYQIPFTITEKCKHCGKTRDRQTKPEPPIGGNDD